MGEVAPASYTRTSTRGLLLNKEPEMTKKEERELKRFENAITKIAKRVEKQLDASNRAEGIK